MPRLDLTDRFVSTIKTKKIADYFDAKTTGLGLRVSPEGTKSWSVLFTIPGTQKRGRLSLGTYPATSLAQARTGAIEARSKVEQGIDPPGTWWFPGACNWETATGRSPAGCDSTATSFRSSPAGPG